MTYIIPTLQDNADLAVDDADPWLTPQIPSRTGSDDLLTPLQWFTLEMTDPDFEKEDENAMILRRFRSANEFLCLLASRASLDSNGLVVDGESAFSLSPKDKDLASICGVATKKTIVFTMEASALLNDSLFTQQIHVEVADLSARTDDFKLKLSSDGTLNLAIYRSFGPSDDRGDRTVLLYDGSKKTLRYEQIVMTSNGEAEIYRAFGDFQKLRAHVAGYVGATSGDSFVAYTISGFSDEAPSPTSEATSILTDDMDAPLNACLSFSNGQITSPDTLDCDLDGSEATISGFKKRLGDFDDPNDLNLSGALEPPFDSPDEILQ